MKVDWIVTEMCLPFSTFQSLKGRWKSHFSKNWNVDYFPVNTFDFSVVLATQTINIHYYINNGKKSFSFHLIKKKCFSNSITRINVNTNNQHYYTSENQTASVSHLNTYSPSLNFIKYPPPPQICISYVIFMYVITDTKF